MAVVSRLAVEQIAEVPFSAAQDYAEAFFRDAEREVRVYLPLRTLVWGLPGRLSRPVKLTLALHPDDEEEGRVHDALMVEWSAGLKLFPHFHGTLRFRIASVDATLLALHGAYRPPAGLAGRVFDALVGRRVARATMTELLDRLVRAMDQRHRGYRAGVGADPEAATAAGLGS